MSLACSPPGPLHRFFRSKATHSSRPTLPLRVKVKQNHPELSHADIWVAAGAAAVEFSGGPKIEVRCGRSDAPNGQKCPAHGRLPDASQGAQHLRDVFHRMGFDDRAIVCLSGAHTMGRCHKTRSGFDGPWTRTPLKFDNMYFKHLLAEEWVERKWDGPLQYEDKATGELMMLPTDLCLLSDPLFRPWVEKYAADEQLFFDDFARDYAALIAKGCPVACQPGAPRALPSDQERKDAHFREHAMHGSVERCEALHRAGANPHSVEGASGRTALHKAGFWGHTHVTEFLLKTCKVDPNVQDNDGDTALHDAARFGHDAVAELLCAGGADTRLRNKRGQTAAELALEHGHAGVSAVLKAHL